MLVDPQSITLNGVATSLPRNGGNGVNSNVYATADDLVKLTVRKDRSKAGRLRNEFRLEQSKVAPDPISAVNKSVGATVYIVVDRPSFGFSNAELGYLIEALKAAFVAGTYNKVLGGEF